MNASPATTLLLDTPALDRSHSRQERLVEALAEYHGAVDAGKPPDRDAFLKKYLDLRDELLGYLDSFDLIRAVAPQMQSGGKSPGSILPERAGNWAPTRVR